MQEIKGTGTAFQRLDQLQKELFPKRSARWTDRQRRILQLSRKLKKVLRSVEWYSDPGTIQRNTNAEYVTAWNDVYGADEMTLYTPAEMKKKALMYAERARNLTYAIRAEVEKRDR
jgi:hypothetical protein